MVRLRSLALGVLLATTALAGCIGGDDLPTAYTVDASGGTVSDGWAYDGQGLVTGTAAIEGSVDVEEDTGTLNVTFEAWNSTWTATLDSYSGTEPYKEGGIAQELVAHGDTGTASTAMPRVELELATWGTGEVLRDGEPYSIGEGSSGAWTTHLMLSKDTIRGPDGQIAKENGTGPYDPSTPTNARVIEDDPQGILELIAPSGQDADRAPENVTETASFQGPENAQSYELPTSAYSNARVGVSTSGAENLQLGDIQVAILDENGTELAQDSSQVQPNEPYNQTFELSGLAGPTTVDIRGNGTYDVELNAEITYDDHAFIVVTWDDYSLEPR